MRNAREDIATHSHTDADERMNAMRSHTNAYKHVAERAQPHSALRENARANARARICVTARLFACGYGWQGWVHVHVGTCAHVGARGRICVLARPGVRNASVSVCGRLYALWVRKHSLSRVTISLRTCECACAGIRARWRIVDVSVHKAEIRR
jgi:hypothetical protein